MTTTHVQKSLPLPPVGGGFREVMKSCEFNGYFIPQGWSVLYQIARTQLFFIKL